MAETVSSMFIDMVLYLFISMNSLSGNISFEVRRDLQRNTIGIICVAIQKAMTDFSHSSLAGLVEIPIIMPHHQTIYGRS